MRDQFKLGERLLLDDLFGLGEWHFHFSDLFGLSEWHFHFSDLFGLGEWRFLLDDLFGLGEWGLLFNLREGGIHIFFEDLLCRLEGNLLQILFRCFRVR